LHHGSTSARGRVGSWRRGCGAAFGDRAIAHGPLAALDDGARSGKASTITPQAKAWLVALACRKAKDLGYPHKL